MRLLIVFMLALWVVFGGAVVANNGVLFAPSSDQSTITEIETEARRRSEPGQRTIPLPRPPRSEDSGEADSLAERDR